MNKKKELQLKIELIRNELIRTIADDYEKFQKENIIQLSQELDKLIVEYQKLIESDNSNS